MLTGNCNFLAAMRTQQSVRQEAGENEKMLVDSDLEYLRITTKGKMIVDTNPDNNNIYMNKIISKISILAVAFVAVACNVTDKAKFELDPNEVNLTWYGEYDHEKHCMHYNENWAGCGWSFGDDSIKPSADFSAYDQLVVVVDSISTDTTTLFLNVRYTTSNIITSMSAPIINKRTTLRVDLDSVGKSHVLETYVMSKRPCDLVMKTATFCKATRYGKKRVLKTRDGFIDASQFKGYSDDALVSFNYFVDGLMIHVDSGIVKPMDNWGIGKICSSADVNENVCRGRQIILKKIGEQSFDCRLGDLRYMIDFDGGNGRRGLYWSVWMGGQLTEVRMINTTIREAKN